MSKILWLAICMAPLSGFGQRTIQVEDIGKDYALPAERLVEGLYNHIEHNDSVIGGNTSIRNVSAAHLVWKGEPDANGYGYFQRNRDLGQVFVVPPGPLQVLRAIVLRTSRGNNAIMAGAPGAEISLAFYEVVDRPGESVRINNNGTGVGELATHGFDRSLNRCDDYIEGVDYLFLRSYTGGVFPEVPATTQYVYNRGKGEPFGEQPGHLRYFRCLLPADEPLVLEGGKRYAFMIGFGEPGPDRGLALAILSGVHRKAPAAFVRDANGERVWGIRREGDGSLPPTTSELPEPPEDPEILATLLRESLFPENHFETLEPTSDGYPDVDTYRTLQYYLEFQQ